MSASGNRHEKSKILVVGPSWVGDMVMAQSLFINLRNKYPKGVIDVLAPSWSLPILERMPEVNQGIAIPAGHGELNLSKRRQVGQSLRQTSYDQAIVLTRSLKAALIPFFAKIPQRTGYRGEMRYGLLNDIRPFDKSVLNQTVKRFVALGLDKHESQSNLKYSYPKLNIKHNNAEQLLQTLSLNKNRAVVGIAPGAEYGPSKQWPLEYFAELVKKLDEIDIDTWIFGSAKDSEAAKIIIKQSGDKGVDLCGKTKLEDVIDLIALTDMMVTNDSGLMHVAAAVNTKLIGIYGSTTPDFTPPLTENAIIQDLRLECSPCFKRECPLGHLNCLKGISVESIFQQIKQSLPKA
jgi:heptosyltransferase-2